MQLSTGEFKSKCLQIMDKVEATGEEVVITKSGKPIAKLVPIQEASRSSLFGFMKGSVKINGDIIAPTSEEWDVEN